MILPRKVVQKDIVLVPPVAGRDRPCGETDDLPILSYRFIHGNRHHRQLMPARNTLACGDGRGRAARQNGIDRHHYVVCGGEADDTWSTQFLALPKCNHRLLRRNKCDNLGRRTLFRLAFSIGAAILLKTPGHKRHHSWEENMANRPSRRALLKTAALGSAATITAPYISGVYAAGTITMGCWDHWVPGANKALDKLCKKGGKKNKVEVHIDYITSQGEKDKLTAAAEAQAGTGHDIMSHRDWNIRIHAELLEPLGEIAAALTQPYGPISPVAEYLAKIKGAWRGVPAASGSQVKPCCSRLDLYKEHAGIDLREVFPPDETKWDSAKVNSWNWDAYLAAAEKLFKAGYPVGLPMGQTSDSVDWVGALFNAHGVVMVDAKDNIKINSDEIRAVLEYAKKLMAVIPPDVYAWDDAGNNRWLISGKGSGIMNPPSAWAVAKRDNFNVAENCWTHPVPRGPKGRFVAERPQFYGIWKFSKSKQAAKDL